MRKKRKHEQNLAFDTEQLIQAALMRKKRKHEQDLTYDTEQLIQAALNGNTEKLIDIRNRHTRDDFITIMTTEDSSHETALMKASENGLIKVVTLLLNSLRETGADISTAINQVNLRKNTALTLASRNGHTETVQLLLKALSETDTVETNRNLGTALIIAANMIQIETVKLLLAHGANCRIRFGVSNIYDADAWTISTHIADDTLEVIDNNDPNYSKFRFQLISIVANPKFEPCSSTRDLSWMDTSYANYDSKSSDEQNLLHTLASWGVIVGNQTFVTKMISIRGNTLTLAEHTEYLRLALQAQKFSIAKTVLEHVHESDPEHTNNRQSILNYLLRLMLVEKGPLSAINFLLAQGASPKNEIREENSYLATHTLFKQHTKYQIHKVCRQKTVQHLTQQSVLQRFITIIKQEKPIFTEGINPKDIRARAISYLNRQTLFDLFDYDNRPALRETWLVHSLKGLQSG